MARTVILFGAVLASFSAISAQCLNRMLPALQPSILPVAETLIPNQVLVNQVPNYLPFEYGIEPLYPAPMMPTTTIIQDSTVANNLANALQLLVVSNLLSNTLPTAGEVIVPIEYGPNLLSPVAMPCGGFGGFNYVY
ncbi:uncharacterized protein LOC115439807 [Manduca sexta]|uniref:Uncharacterized protein n=1 Tax=Manduca sexta TaxID=7130 RepID=A0A922CFI9_MANSE|nr:uncharacterized protein LOC115439807 [Manduca sexta]KAG6444382.1 hypothetical protein O3G_MSEX003382 [Manduca sexta]